MGFHLTKVSGMLWPNPLEEWCDELEHKLRYPLGERLSASDRLVTASIIAAYRELVRCPEKKRETVVRGLKEAARAEQRTLTAPPNP